MYQRSPIKFDAEKIAESIGLDKDNLIEIFQDGRALYPIVKSYLGGLLTDDCTLRILTKSIDFAQSKHKGSKRPFISDGFLKDLSSTKKFIVADALSFPNVNIWEIPSSNVVAWWKNNDTYSSPRMSRKTFLNFVSGG